MKIVEGMREGRLDGLPLLKYINFLILSDKESVIVIPVINAHTLSKKGQIKTVLILKRLPRSLVP